MNIQSRAPFERPPLSKAKLWTLLNNVDSPLVDRRFKHESIDFYHYIKRLRFLYLEWFELFVLLY